MPRTPSDWNQVESRWHQQNDHPRKQLRKITQYAKGHRTAAFRSDQCDVATKYPRAVIANLTTGIATKWPMWLYCWRLRENALACSLG
jgi:hypothetical protein